MELSSLWREIRGAKARAPAQRFQPRSEANGPPDRAGDTGTEMKSKGTPSSFFSVGWAGWLLAFTTVSPALAFSADSLRVQEVLCRFGAGIGRQTLPKRASSTGRAELDQVLMAYGLASVESIPPFELARGPAPPLAKLVFARPVDLDSLRSSLQATGLIEYVSRNHVYRVDYVPNDSAFYAQWVPKKLRLSEVWDIVRGTPDVVVGIIDTGIDPSHPDLVDAIWVNPGEDLDGDGRPTVRDSNGLDDDGNGLVDDVWGWDFVDAPRHPDRGDYRDPDNEPLDEHGHGTAVAGIIAATGDNRIGIAGVAHGTKLMILRAGTARGLLEEDDVAAAIFYAVDKGARIINMSFGDTEEAPFLRDVIAYAYQRGLCLVASAGNSGDDTPHYPAGLQETFGVGASTESDEVASFSSFGEAVDFVAPGVSVLTTAPGGRYERLTGTSAAAPVVSGICALLLAANPQFTVEQLRGKLAATAVDIWLPGWDRRSGAGRVEPLAALAPPSEVFAQIREPCSQCTVGGPHESIVGSASGPHFSSYAVLLGQGTAPDRWDTLNRSIQRVVEGELASWQPGLLPEGPCVLRLVVNGLDGVSVEDRVPIHVDHSPPILSEVLLEDLYENEWPATLISFRTSDPARARLRWRPTDSPSWRSTESPYVGTEHHFLLTQQQSGQDFEYEIEAENLRGQLALYASDAGPLQHRVPGHTIPTDYFVETLASLRLGDLCPVPADMNGNGQLEVILCDNTGSLSDRLRVFEWDGVQWRVIAASDRPWLARDAADLNGDGRDELLVSWLGQSGVLSLSATDPKLREIWRKDDDFQAARFLDLNADGKREMAVLWRGEWTVWEQTEDTGFAYLLSLPNPTPGENTSAGPRIGWGDTNGNGRPELGFADEDGDLLVYELSPDRRTTLLFQSRTPLPGCSAYLDLADLDGDGKDEIIVGCHSTESVDPEHEFDARRWIYQVHSFDGQSGYRLWREWHFFGYGDDQGLRSHLTVTDLDGSGAKELLIGAAPDFYVLRCANPLNAELVGYLPAVSTSASVAADFDGDGTTELAITQDGQTRFYRPSGPAELPPPLRVRAQPVDEHAISLEWNPVRTAQAYETLREGPDGPRQLGLWSGTTYTDTTVEGDKVYRYWVRSLGVTGQTSRWAISNPVRPHTPPSIAKVEQAGQASLLLRFTAPMGSASLQADHYRLCGPDGTPRALSSIARGSRPDEFLLTLREAFSRPEILTLVALNLADTSGALLRPNPDTAIVHVEPPLPAPYVLEAVPISKSEIVLRFSEAMREQEIADPGNYRILPRGGVLLAEPLEGGRAVRLVLSREAPLLPLGETYRIEVGDVHNLSGARIRRGLGDCVAVRLVPADLSSLVVYPNPWRPQAGSSTITFGGVPRGAEVFILDTTGRLLRRLEAQGETGRVNWDLNTDGGEPIASGIYLYWVRTDRESRMGKFAVLR